MNRAEWQQKIDAYFPLGVNITWHLGPTDDEEPQEVVPRPYVMGVSTKGLPQLRTFSISVDRDIPIDVASIESDIKGRMEVTSEDGVHYLLTDYVPPGAQKLLAGVKPYPITPQDDD